MTNIVNRRTYENISVIDKISKMEEINEASFRCMNGVDKILENIVTDINQEIDNGSFGDNYFPRIDNKKKFMNSKLEEIENIANDFLKNEGTKEFGKTILNIINNK